METLSCWVTYPTKVAYLGSLLLGFKSGLLAPTLVLLLLHSASQTLSLLAEEKAPTTPCELGK